MTAREALTWGQRAGLEAADARALLWGVLDWTATDWLDQAGQPLLPEQQAAYEAALAQRLQGQPVQYILGRWDFGSLTLRCDERALIPRPETELLAEQALSCLADWNHPRVADVGCGTGCIGLSVAHARPDAQVTLLDLSPDALALARENAAELGLRVQTRLQDMAQPLWGAPYDAILSNPPYIPTGDLPHLQAEVQWEPRLALDGGPDGLDCYRHLAARLVDCLRPGGVMVLEVGMGQAEAVAALLRPACQRTAIQSDLAGIPRIVTGWKK